MTEIKDDQEGGGDAAPIPKTRKKAAPSGVLPVYESTLLVCCPNRIGAAVWLADGRVLRAGQMAHVNSAEAVSLIKSGVVYAHPDLLNE